MAPRTLIGLAIATAIVCAPVCASANVTFIDTTFNLADYTESTKYTFDATLTYKRCKTCGYPKKDPGLQFTVVARHGTGSAAIALINDTFHYDPATSGAIASISASVEKDLFISASVTNFSNTFYVTIEQDGNFYIDPITGPSLTGRTTGYNLISGSDLTAADFTEFDFATDKYVSGDHPNFASGDTMYFGLTQMFNLIGFPGRVQSIADYDDLTFTLNSAPPPPIPEPATWALLALGFAGIAFVGGRAARRSAALKG